jgi:integral membrane protein (TIGR01906 family)
MSQAQQSPLTFARWIVIILVPIVLVVGSVRLLISPLFLEVEYRTPFFPADPYGFSREDRLTWSKATLVYLTQGGDMAYLEGLAFDDGTPIYNERELTHIQDALGVYRSAMLVLEASIILLIVLGVWARFGGWWRTYLAAIGRGGLATAILVGVIVVIVLVAFGIFFVFFHEVFFRPGTWQFFYSDTLIRLFPERFWRDAFLWIGGLSGVTGLLLWYFFVRRRRLG